MFWPLRMRRARPGHNRIGGRPWHRFAAGLGWTCTRRSVLAVTMDAESGELRSRKLPGIGCMVAAPGKIERPAQDKVKTDQRDSERVLRLLMIDALHAVRIPSVEEEALRDLVRAREDLRGDLMRTRQRLSKLLLRHGIVY